MSWLWMIPLVWLVFAGTGLVALLIEYKREAGKMDDPKGRLWIHEDETEFEMPYNQRHRFGVSAQNHAGKTKSLVNV